MACTLTNQNHHQNQATFPKIKDYELTVKKGQKQIKYSIMRNRKQNEE